MFRTPEEKMAKRLEKLAELKKLDKMTLLERFSRLCRIHSTKSDSIDDIVYAILDYENPITMALAKYHKGM